MKIKLWEVYRLNTLINILDHYKEELYYEREAYFIREDLKKTVNLKTLQAILSAHLTGLKAISSAKEIKPHLEHSYLTIYYISFFESQRG